MVVCILFVCAPRPARWFHFYLKCCRRTKHLSGETAAGMLCNPHAASQEKVFRLLSIGAGAAGTSGLWSRKADGPTRKNPGSGVWQSSSPSYSTTLASVLGRTIASNEGTQSAHALHETCCGEPAQRCLSLRWFSATACGRVPCLTPAMHTAAGRKAPRWKTPPNALTSGRSGPLTLSMRHQPGATPFAPRTFITPTLTIRPNRRISDLGFALKARSF